MNKKTIIIVLILIIIVAAFVPIKEIIVSRNCETGATETGKTSLFGYYFSKNGKDVMECSTSI